MRRVLALLALAAILVGILPGAVVAAPPTTTEIESTVVSCGVTTETGLVAFYAELNAQFGNFGDLQFWASPADPGEDAPTLVSSEAAVSGTPSAIDATYTLVEFDPTIDPPFGDPAGEASLAAELTPIGDPVAVDDRFRNGNTWEEVQGTVQAQAVTGTLTMPGEAPVDITDCSGETSQLTITRSQPASTIFRFASFSVECFWEFEGGGAALFGLIDDFGSFFEVAFSDASGDYFAGGEGGLSRTAWEATFDFFAPDGETVVGGGTLSAVLEASGIRVRTKEDNGIAVVRLTSEAYAVDGVLEVSTPAGDQSLPLDSEHCFANDTSGFAQELRPGGPKPGPLANDTPDGAVALKTGRTVKVATGGTAVDPEEPCVVEFENELFELPITNTAWWTFTGNGEAMTVDTAGSSFDTIVGVYTLDGDTFTPLACVDDVFDPFGTFSARATIDTAAGETYYVQAGGFAGSTGRLHVTME